MSEHSTLQEVFDAFDASSITQGTTRQKCRSAWSVLMKQFGATARAESLTSEHIARLQRFMRDEAKTRYGTGYSEHAVFSYIAAISQVFRWAAHPDRRYVAANPVARCDRMKPNRKQVHIYTPDEIRDMLATVRGDPERDIASLRWPDAAGELRWTAFFLTALCGPRIGEIWNLRWDDLDLDGGTLQIRYRLDKPGEYWRWGTKGKADRPVPMSDDLWAVLMRLREVAPWRYPFLKERTCRDKQGRVGDLNEFQRKYPYCNFHRELAVVLAETNRRRRTDNRPTIEDGKFHTLRKNAATTMAEAGVPSHFCQEVLGHASDRLTKEVYTYVDSRKCQAAARQAFNAVSY
jgi:integrase